MNKCYRESSLSLTSAYFYAVQTISSSSLNFFTTVLSDCQDFPILVMEKSLLAPHFSLFFQTSRRTSRFSQTSKFDRGLLIPVLSLSGLLATAKAFCMVGFAKAASLHFCLDLSSHSRFLHRSARSCLSSPPIGIFLFRGFPRLEFPILTFVSSDCSWWATSWKTLEFLAELLKQLIALPSFFTEVKARASRQCAR